jgi:hypothetical protein
MTVTEKVFNGLQAAGYHSKIEDIFESADSIRKTYNHPTMSGSAKVAKCASEGTFLVTRVAEVTHKITDPSFSLYESSFWMQ